MTEQKCSATPSSGRTWKKGRLGNDDDEMIPMAGGEADIIPVGGDLEVVEVVEAGRVEV